MELLSVALLCSALLMPRSRSGGSGKWEVGGEANWMEEDADKVLCDL